MSRPDGLSRALHLLALCSFAILQPVLDLLGQNPGFLVARKLSPGEIVLLVLASALVPPLLLWSVERAISLLSSRAGSWVQGLWVAGLAMLIAMPLLNRHVALSMPVELIVLASIGVVSAVVYFRLAAARMFLGMAGLAPLLFAALFFLRSPASGLITGQVLGGGGDEARIVPVTSRTPIVFVIFDELPLHSLLDESGEVDPVRYPAFARLAAKSHWFRNTAAVDWRTLQVLPSILSGRYPEMKKRLPVADEYPENLFSLLSPHYRMNIVETHTQLFAGEQRRRPFRERGVAALRDLGVVYLHLVLPARLAEGLPSVSRTWKDFGGANEPTAAGAHESGGDRTAEFRDFVRSIDDESASLHFIHVMLPHSPWQYAPDGSTYLPSNFEGATFGVWLDEPWWAVQAQQRHLLQLEFVDGLLAELLDHLEEIGLFEEALVVVTADHGASFWATGAYRDLARAEHPEDIMGVPLFIKEPGQREVVEHDAAVESVDILPTLLDLLDIETPWKLDGCSPLSAGCRVRDEVIAYSEVEYASEDNQRLSFPVEILGNDESLALKLERFGSGRTPGALYRIGPYGEWVGHDAAPLIETPQTGGGALRLSDGVRVDPVPHRLHAILELNPAPPEDALLYVAVVVDGMIEAIVPAITDGRNALRKRTGFPIKPERIVSAMLESGGETKSLAVYLVSGTPEKPVLHALAIR